jgi:P27 family predicted phage terminase small subunit
MRQAIREKPYLRAPRHLSKRSRQLWRELGPKHVKTTGKRTLFQAALEALDRADEAAALVRTEGLTQTTKSTGAVHVHPAAKVEREARQQFARIWCDLHLQFAGEPWEPVTLGK